jgi:endonuclease YncB( thermonuclease family)
MNSKISALAFGKEVTIQTHGHDKYKRTLADVLLPDGMNLNQELVKQGCYWWYRKYAPGDTVLEGLEREAREGRKGLWADPQPVPPWEWRAQRREAAKGSPHAQYEHPDPYAETHQCFVHTVSMVLL